MLNLRHCICHKRYQLCCVILTACYRNFEITDFMKQPKNITWRYNYQVCIGICALEDSIIKSYLNYMTVKKRFRLYFRYKHRQKTTERFYPLVFQHYIIFNNGTVFTVLITSKKLLWYLNTITCRLHLKIVEVKF